MTLRFKKLPCVKSDEARIRANVLCGYAATLDGNASEWQHASMKVRAENEAPAWSRIHSEPYWTDTWHKKDKKIKLDHFTS